MEKAGFLRNFAQRLISVPPYLLDTQEVISMINTSMSTEVVNFAEPTIYGWIIVKELIYQPLFSDLNFFQLLLMIKQSDYFLI